MWMILVLVASVGATTPVQVKDSYKTDTLPCSPACGPNEYYDRCPPQCPAQKCSSLWSKFPCPPDDGICRPACRCIDGFFRNDQTGICITTQQCISGPDEPTTPPTTIPNRPIRRPPIRPPKCGRNEKRVKCRTLCPPQSCEISYTSYLCDFPLPCEPGCDCIPNFLRNSSGVCILNNNCPPAPFNQGVTTVVENPTGPGPSEPVTTPVTTPLVCGANETEVPCQTVCPPQSCDISYTDYSCTYPIACTRGCDCIKNHLRNKDNVCILNDECPPLPFNHGVTTVVENPTGPGPSEPVTTPVTTPLVCGANETEVPCQTVCPPQSCVISYTEYSCTYPIACIRGCDCIKNHLRNKDNVCILNDECPPPSFNQPAVENPTPLVLEPPSSPDVGIINSAPPSKILQSSSSAYAQSSSYLDSKSSSSRASSSSSSYSSTSSKNQTPPSPSTSTSTATPCTPPTTCSANETYVNCNAGCPTNNCPVDDRRAVPQCSPPYPCPPGCACKRNFKRKSYEDYTCIAVEDCPPVTCTRPNEVFDICPSSCLAESCYDVNSPPSVCNEFVRNCQPKCVCQKGYYRNDSDICVPAAQCPANQCSANETYVPCNVRCPTNNCPVDDSRAFIACSIAYPCPPGCACKQNYRSKSNEDPTCILAKECPPVDCTRPNEEWNSCPSPCLAEGCQNANDPPTACNELVEDCFPKCVCKQGFFRNDNDICVPVNECEPKIEPAIDPIPDESCSANETYVFCKAGCPYDYCPTDDSRGIIACDPPQPCPKGCICKLNHKRKSLEDETCILSSECPPVNCTRPNEVWSPCPSACLGEYCDDSFNPTTQCNTLVLNCQPKCVCQDGYYRDQDDICIPKAECAKRVKENPTTAPTAVPCSTTPTPESQCGMNETYGGCTFSCPNQYCPEDDSRFIILCKPPRDCPIGCVCKENYKKISYEDRTCVLASDCPPVNCTRQNEEWSPCSSPCLAESCSDVNNPPSDCNELVESCQPKCICKKGYFRNKDDLCIEAAECSSSS